MFSVTYIIDTPGYPDNSPVTVKLNKSLYCLKPAGKVFYQYLRQILDVLMTFVYSIEKILILVILL